MAAAEQERVLLEQVDIYTKKCKVYEKHRPAEDEPPLGEANTHCRTLKGALDTLRESLNDLDLFMARKFAKSKAADKDDQVLAFAEEFAEMEEKYTLALELYEAMVGPTSKDSHNKALVEAAAAAYTDLKETITANLAHHLTKVTTERSPVTASKLGYYKECLAELKTDIEVDLMTAMLEQSKLEPLRASELRTSYNGHAKVLKVSRRNLAEAISNLNIQAPAPLDTSLAPGVPVRSSTRQDMLDETTMTPGAKKVKYEYKADALPKFSGEYIDYPEFRQEFKESVEPHRAASWCLKKLNSLTPATDDLSRFSSLEEAWEELDSKYSNPLAVADSVMGKFLVSIQVTGNDDEKIIQLEQVLSKIHATLATVSAAPQITNNVFAMSLVVKQIPMSFAKDLSDIRFNSRTPPGKDPALHLWDTIMGFLVDQKKKIYSFRPHTVKDIDKQIQKRLKALGQVNSCTHYSSCPDCAEMIMVNSAGVTPGGGPPAYSAAKMEELQDQYGPCPECKGKHQWSLGGKPMASHRLSDCKQWRELKINKKVQKLKEAKGCAYCTSWYHTSDNCNMKAPKCGYNNCTKKHSRWLHDSTDKYVTGVNQVKIDCNHDVTSPTLLHLTTHMFGKTAVTVFLDDGSTGCLITHEQAAELGLRGDEVDEWIQVAGKEPELHKTKIYKVKFPLGDGKTRLIKMIGMDQITSLQAPANLDFAKKLFPHVPGKAFTRPSKRIGILLGQDQADLLASGGLGRDKVGKLRAMRIPFGSGWVFGGTDHRVVKDEFQLSSMASVMRTARFFDRKPNVTCSFQLVSSPLQCNAAKLDFFEAEAVGISVKKLCKKCTNCPTCTFTDNQRSIKEQYELDLLKSSITLDSVNKCLRVSYPFTMDLNLFQDNRDQAIKRAMSNRKSLVRRGLLDAYQAQLKEYESRGVWKKVTVAEIEEYKARGGHVHYVSHHGVKNDHSKSTPLRVVVDSAMKNCWHGPSLNDATVKGTNSINDLFQVLTRWRSYPEALIWDLEKAYHKLVTGEVEFFMRLVVWQFDEDGPIETFGHTCVGFGDKPASNALEHGKNKAADAGEHIDPVAAEKIRRDMYVDDGGSGGTTEEIDKMVGNVTVTEDGKFSYDGTVTQILDIVGFKIKLFVRSGETDPRVLEKLGPVLGHQWNPTDDTIAFQTTVNLSKRNGASREKPDLTTKDLEMLRKLQFTRRKALQITAGLYDPMGIISAYTIRYKIALKEVVARDLGWDEVLPDPLLTKWRQITADLVTNKPITVPRSVRTKHCLNVVEAIGYWDGADNAFAACIYLRWQMDDNDHWHTALIASKARVTPKSGISTPRSEMSGLVVLCRLMDALLPALDVKPRRVTLIGDSSCVIAAADFNAAALAAYFSNRVVEVLELMEKWGIKSNLLATQEITNEVLEDVIVDTLQHTAGPLNPADLATRGTMNAADIGVGSLWQTGPEYLAGNRSQWPVSRKFNKEVPKEETKAKFISIAAAVKLAGDHPKLQRLRDIMARHDSLMKVRRIFARVAAATRLDDIAAITKDPEVEDFKLADRWLQLLSYLDTLTEIQQGNLSSYAPFQCDGLWYTRGRFAKDDMKRLIGHDKLLLVSNKSRLAELIMIHTHREDHRQDPSACWNRSIRHGVWIIKGRVLAERVTKNCWYCKIRNARTSQQLMADLPSDVTMLPCRPFSHVALDFMAPIMVRDPIKKRVKMKCFPILIVCLNVKAVHILLADGYSTEAFMLQFAQFVSLRGYPQYVYCDLGSQLVSAGKALDTTHMAHTVNWTKVKADTAQVGITWRHAPSQSQWRDPAEAIVKQAKKTFKLLVPNEDLGYLEVQTLLCQVADVLNNRPIGARRHNKAEPEFVPITPNLLMLGQRTESAPMPEPESEDMSTMTRRQRYLRQVFSDWWQAWFQQNFQSLMTRKKWKFPERNLCVGDICLLKFTKSMTPAEFRYCVVQELELDNRGLARTVTVGLRPRDQREPSLPYKSKKLTQMRVPVQRLAVILPHDMVESLPDSEFDHVVPTAEEVLGYTVGDRTEVEKFFCHVSEAGELHNGPSKQVVTKLVSMLLHQGDLNNAR